MRTLSRPFGSLHVRTDGPVDAPSVVLANSLGTDLRLWDAVLPLLPSGLRYLRFDKQGHGLSDLGQADRIEHHAADIAALIEAEARAPAIVVGVSIGGLIAQRLAADRPDLVRALVLSNTAARLGTPQGWQERIDAVEEHGPGGIADAVMERWFAPDFRAVPGLSLWRNMMARTSPEGYIAACRALAAADQTQATAALRLPALVVAGGVDGASPPDQVRATADLIQGADFRLLADAGHLPCVETPAAFVATVSPFLERHAR